MFFFYFIFFADSINSLLFFLNFYPEWQKFCEQEITNELVWIIVKYYWFKKNVDGKNFNSEKLTNDRVILVIIVRSGNSAK